MIAVLDVGERCYRCFNRGVAEQHGVEFEEVTFPALVIADAVGARHTFQVRSMLMPAGLELEAVETPRSAPGGYRFAVLGAVDADPRALFETLEERIRAALAATHVEKTAHGWHVGSANRLVGRIEWDPDTDGRTPLLVIDGRPFAWEDVGRMLMTFEGFTIDLPHRRHRCRHSAPA